MSNPMISWKHDLGNPQNPGDYPVRGHGIVTVKQEDIEEAQKLNGDVNVEICDTSTFGSSMKTFILGKFVPA